MLGQAFRKATAAPLGVTHLSLPMDVLDSTVPEPATTEISSSVYPRFRVDPEEEAVHDALGLLESSSAPVIVVGGGVHSSRAWNELREFAEHLGIPVAQTLTSCGCIGDSPYSIGVVGENGYRDYANTIVGEADVVLLFGTAVESVWTSKWARPDDATQAIIHVDINPDRIGLNYQTDVSILGDLRKTLVALMDGLEERTYWESTDLDRRHQLWLETYKPHFTSSVFPLRPERMVADTQHVLDDDAIIVSDPGTSCPYFAALYDFPTVGRNWLTPRAHGALGYTIPGVIGAHYARPDTQIIGFTGDGSFGTSVGDLETMARENLPVTIVVVNNAAFSWIEAGQQSYAEYSFGVDFSPMNYADIARGFGLSAHRIESPAEYETALAQAVTSDSPVLIDLPVEPLPNLDHTPVDWLEPDE
jgi:acetolactate synthase-1/2/3 large subunit